MLRRRVLASVFLALGACGEANPARESPPAPDTASQTSKTPFRYQPTLDAHRPANSEMELLAEAGDVAKGRLMMVVAHHDGAKLSVDAWTFESTGDDETLIPKAAPTALLPIAPGDSADTETLDAFVRTRAAGHSAAARPQGISADDATAALAQLHTAAITVLDVTAQPAERVAALAVFSRGLDDDLLFSRRGLANALAALSKDGPASIADGSSRRADARWGDAKVSMLRKGDGWTVDAIESSTASF